MGRATSLRPVAEGWHLAAIDMTQPTYADDPGIVFVIADIAERHAECAPRTSLYVDDVEEGSNGYEKHFI